MTDQLAAALVAFQGQVTTIAKTRIAEIETKSGRRYCYKFADLSDVWEAIRKPLHDNGLAVTQPLTTATTAGCMAIRTIIWHSSGQSLSEVVEFTTAGKTPQEIGSVITYMRRYALTSALGLDTDIDDDGNAANKLEPPRNDPAEKARAALRQLVKDQGLDGRGVADRFKADYGMDLRTADAATIRGFTQIVREEVAIDEAAE